MPVDALGLCLAMSSATVILKMLKKYLYLPRVRSIARYAFSVWGNDIICKWIFIILKTSPRKNLIFMKPRASPCLGMGVEVGLTELTTSVPSRKCAKPLPKSMVMSFTDSCKRQWVNLARYFSEYGRGCLGCRQMIHNEKITRLNWMLGHQGNWNCHITAVAALDSKKVIKITSHALSAKIHIETMVSGLLWSTPDMGFRMRWKK